MGKTPENPPGEFFGKIGLIFCSIPIKHFFQPTASTNFADVGW
jgi:hypothetical protein